MQVLLNNSEQYDSELLCLAYDNLGEDLFSELKGSYSFVLYDPEKLHYFCARDELGIKALYYTKTDDSYHFSSNIDVLLNLPKVSKKVNLVSLNTMLHQQTVDYTDTMYEGIFRLPPGHYMHIINGKIEMKRYWYPEKIAINYNITEQEASNTLKDILIKAVHKCITSLEETAFELSGGLDSSSIVCLLSKSIDPSNIDSYSMTFQGLKCDETRYIDSILKQYPLHHQKVVSSKLDYHQQYSLNNLYNMSPNWPITLTFASILPMLDKMKQDGKKFVITGQGGDHLFNGTPYSLYDLFRRFKFLILFQELKIYAKPWNMVKTYIVKPILGEKCTKFILKILGRQQNNTLIEKESKVIDLSTKLGIKNPAYKHDLDMVTMASNTTVLDANLFHSVENHFNLEFRHPFFDLQLVEFALSLPPEMKYKQKTIKWILRRAMNGIIPDKIRDRKDKAEFSEVIIEQIDALDLSTLLDDPYIVKLGLIEQDVIDRYRKEYEEKKVKYIIFLWSIINVEYWYRYNFEEESLIDRNKK